ncbi:MAG: putative sulfate exporter family transporter, partial [Rhodospirillales bacterium]|nr:putative sulfate exporter family transporter [Rhodospirillales bacterium]
MRNSVVASELARLWAPDNLRRSAPGIALCAAIAAVAYYADTRSLLRFGAVWVPPLILTLVIGMALQPLSAKPVLKPGLEFAGRTLLRIGVALLGARLTFGQLVEGGAMPIVIALAAVGCTIVFGAWAARLFGLNQNFGLLTGCATGVCGAAAAMAASAVLPKHENSARDLAFTGMG